jgi:hypothetical protein
MAPKVKMLFFMYDIKEVAVNEQAFCTLVIEELGSYYKDVYTCNLIPSMLILNHGTNVWKVQTLYLIAQ